MASLRLQGLRPLHLASVDLGLEAGELCWLEGPSGSGKSLLLRAIADLDPHVGEALLDGVARATLPPSVWRRRVGLLPTESGWWAERVGEHFPPEFAVGSEADARLLDALGFKPEALDWSVARLSSGERQRLALARLLAHQPEALLLDEPTTNLDADNTERVEALVERYRRRHLAAVLWVSHDPAQRRRLGGRLLRIVAGQVRAVTD